MSRDAPYPDHETCVLAAPEPRPGSGSGPDGALTRGEARRRSRRDKKEASFQSAAVYGAQLMECAKDLVDTSWPGVDLFAHLGGQVDMDMVLGDAVAILARAEIAHVRGDRVQAGRLEDAALDRLRDGYRTHWNLPGTKDLLAHGSHLMIRGVKDFGTMLLREGAPITSLQDGMMVGSVQASEELRSGYVYRATRRLAQRVFREYQRQLWDPLPNCAEAAVSAAELNLDNRSLRDLTVDLRRAPSSGERP